MSSPSPAVRPTRATAHANIALVKYWGKRPPVAGHPTDLNLPAVGSLSMTLSGLRTVTTVEPAGADSFALDGAAETGKVAQKVFTHLDRVWALSGTGTRPGCKVVSANHFPTAAGLASSASGFAALTVAAAHAFGVDRDRGELSGVARQGSGSAARSLWGGFVRLDRGTAPDGTDCRARPLFSSEQIDVRLLVVHTATGKKPEGSTSGMERSRETSPYYGAWVDTSEADLDAAEAALVRRDLPALGEVMEHSCFKMHACMWATRPPLVYWNGTSLEAIKAVWAAREDGVPGWVTSDAGPHIKVLCATEHAEPLQSRLAAVPGVHEVASYAPGPDPVVEVLS